MTDPEFHTLTAGPRPPTPYSHAVEAGGLVFLSGQLPNDPGDPNAPVPEGIAAQAERVIGNLEIVLRGIGLGLEDVLMARIYLIDFAGDYDGFNAVWLRHFPADRMPARTTVGVAALGLGARVEVDVVAARPQAPAGQRG